MSAEPVPAAGPLRLRPVTLLEARQFVAAHHRHNGPPRGWVWGVGLEQGGELVAVAMAGRPLARLLDDGRTLEILRVCTLGTPNAASRLYGALCRAGQALGYSSAITYTLLSEPGSSLRASGFVAEYTGPDRSGWAAGNWSQPGRERYDATLWGKPTLPAERRVRWRRAL